jgi:hypothetical protein
MSRGSSGEVIIRPFGFRRRIRVMCPSPFRSSNPSSSTIPSPSLSRGAIPARGECGEFGSFRKFSRPSGLMLGMM